MASKSPETDIPVDRIITQYPICRDIIKKLSKKWEKRTKKLKTKWPAEGTFDVAMCREMKALIKNHKPHDKTKKREQKRQKEQEVLDLFIQQAIKDHKKKQLEEQKKKMEEKVERPPPYTPPYQEIKKQMPMVRGTLEVDGNLSVVETDEEDDEEQQRREGEKEYAHQKDDEQGSYQENNGQKKTNKPVPVKKRLTATTKTQQEQREEEQRNSLMDCSYVKQRRQEKERKGGGKRNPLLNNPYFYMGEAIQELNRAGRDGDNEPMTREQEEGGSVDPLDHELNKLQEAAEKLSLEKQQRCLTERARHLRGNLEEEENEHWQRRRAHSASPLGRHRRNSSQEEYRRVSGTLRLERIPPGDPMWRNREERQLISPAESLPILTPYQTGNLAENWGDLNPFQAQERYSPGGYNSMLQPEVTYDLITSVSQAPMLQKKSKQLPILIKGEQAQYVPWAGQDLEGLVARLPDIHEGAGKWIRLLEAETIGKILAIGDIKALLAKSVGGAKTNEILEDAGLKSAVGGTRKDATTFDQYRSMIWRVLRKHYPTQMDPKLLKGEQLGEMENPTSYIQKQLRRWKEELEKDPEGDIVMTTLFRTAIVEAMPSAVKARLEDVVGLNSKTTEEFCDHVAHAVEQYMRNEQKLKNQERELQRKQLEDLTSKKKKVQATLKSGEDQTGVMATVNMSSPPMQASVVTPAQAPVMAAAPASVPTPVPQNTPAPAGGVQQPNAPIVIYLPEQQSNRNPAEQQQRRRGTLSSASWRSGLFESF
ncbi:involucrin-like [Chanodichthys erythropterus]|uniref:involucrin-like n=1 Tax=Chanodichthys erythropterus TaxID=933992 RepID=UPI00351DC7BB